MMGPQHRLFGALAGALTASVAGQEWPLVAMTALVATSTAHGWSSPDMDQTGPWQALARLSGPLGPMLAHRRLTHWWALPVAVWWLIGVYVPAGAAWPAYALLAGWVSHLVGDFVFGKLPLLPWGGPKVGLGFKTGGWLENGPARALIILALGFVLIRTPGLTDLTHPLMEAAHR